MENSRIEYVDIAKALSLLLVIASHAYVSFLVRPFLLCYVSLFFVCSGFTQVREVSIKRKFKKLIIPYIYFNCIYIVLALFTGNLKLTNILGVLYGTYALYSPLDTPGNHFFLDILNGPTWFFISLFVSSIWFSILMKLNKERQIYCVVLYFIGTVILHYATNLLFPWQLKTSFFFAILMYFGYWLRQTALLNNLYFTIFCAILYFFIDHHVTYDVNLSIALYGNSVTTCLVGGITGSVLILTISRIISITPAKSLFLTINKSAIFLLGSHMLIMQGV